MAAIKEFKKTPVATVAKVSGANGISEAVKIANEASRNTGKSVVQKQSNPSPVPVQESAKQKSAVDQMWERASRTPQKTEMDDYRKRILGLQRELQAAKDSDARPEAEKMLPAWAYMMSDKDALEYLKNPEESRYADLLLAEQERKRLQDQLNSTRDEMNYRANMGKIDSMSEEQKQDLEMLANSGNGVFSRGVRPGDERRNDGSNPRDQRISAKNRLIGSGIGETQLKDLVETYQRDMNRKNAEQATEEAKQKIDEGGFWGDVAENVIATGRNLVGSVTGGVETVDQAIRRATGNSVYSTADPNRPGYLPSILAGATREATSEQILGEDPTFANKAANILYKGGTSAVDNVLRLLAGGGTAGSLALAGMGSFQDSYRSAAERGADDSTALLYGSVTAALEVATEFLPTENLLGAKSAKECESLLRQAFVQAGLEIPGEEISLWGEIIADAYLMGDKSEDGRLRAELIANGYSKEKADDEIMRRHLMESAETALTTLVSSGGSVYVQGKVDSARNKLADMESRGMAANNAGQAQNLQQTATEAEQQGQTAQQQAAPVEDDGLTDAQRYFRDAENGKTGNTGIEQIIQQTADELSDNMPANETAAKTAEQARLDDAMQRTIFENQRKRGEQEVYEALKEARKGQKELQKEIIRAERRLAETGKGSRARIDQLKAKLEQQDGLVRQLESQNQYFTGNYERTVGEAVQAQEAVFADAKARAAQAISDYEAGKITEAQKNAEVDAYNRAGAELKRLMGMTQEQYRADLAEAGLVGDFEDYNIQQQEPSTAYSTAFDVDREKTQGYNNSNNKPGGMNNAGTEYQDGQQNDGAGGSGDPASGLAGVQQSNGTNNQGRRQPGGLAGNAGVVRLSEKIQEAHRNRGTQTYTVLETTGNPERYERALTDGRNSDKKNGWCVTPKSEKELRDGNVRTFMNESGTVGVGVAPDGDIVAVFKNKNGGPRKALDTIMPIAIEQGGDRLDCYGEGLVKVYSNYGFVPVARVEFNPKYANDGWTPDKGTPFIYVMKHNGDSADKVVTNMGNYDIPSQDQLNSLPTYGKDDYDSAISYRDSLMKQKRSRLADTQNMSANGGQNQDDTGIKGTGAAERNFSGKAAYQDLLSDENAQRDRPGDVRHMEVPKEDGNRRKVSEFAGNAYGAEVTPDRMANEIESLIQDGALGFDRRSNRQSLESAQQYIYGSDGVKGKGEAGTRNEITKNIANGKIADGDIEKAMLLYAKYANRKSQSSQENAAELMVDLATMANMTGRNLQLFKILRRMTPEGQLMAVQKTVERNVESLQRGGKVKKGYSPDIDPQLMQDYKDAAKACIDADSPQKQKEAEARRKQVEDAIYVSEAAKMPATFKAKWDAWRYMCMLGNAKTQARNIVGNASFMPYKAVKDKMGALLEKALPKDQRTKSVTMDSGLLEWARADAKSEEVQNALKYSAKLGDDVSASKLAENQTIFNTKALEEIRKFTEKIPAAGDMLFKNPYYSKSLAGFLRARGYSAADVKSGKVDSTILNEARGYAIEEAMKATFNDSNAFSDFMANGLRYKGENPVGKILNTMAEGVLPFRRTPANIIVRFTEYSPIGVGKSLWNMATKVRGGEMTAATAIDQLSAGLTGTGAMMLGYALANGLCGVKLTGSGLSEDEKRQGHQEYALEFSYGGKEYSYKIDWAAPANMPLFVGANIRDLLESRGADTDISKFTAFIRGMGTMFEPMLALSCLSGLNEILESISYADSDEKLYALISSTATSYFMQGIPTLARQASQVMNENKRVNFSDSTDPTIRDIQKTAAQIPFIGNQFKTDKVTPWGEKESAGGTEERVFNSFLNPGTLKEIDNGPLEEEITRLNGSQPENVTPPYAGKVISYTDKNGGEHLNQRLTEEQYQTLATVQGQTAKMIGEKMLKSSDYQAMTDAQKAEAVKLAYQYAQAKGRGAALEDYPEMSGWMAGADGKEASVIIKKVMAGTLEKAVEDMATAWKNGWDYSGSSKTLENTYNSLKSMSLDTRESVLEQSPKAVRDYADARDAGISNQKYVDILKDKAAQERKKGGELTQVENVQRIDSITGITAKQMELLLKAEVSDKQDKAIDTVKRISREEGISSNYARLYADLYDIAENYTSGDGKKKRTVREIARLYNISYQVAKELYEAIK